jgi:ferredoxin-NADP reductase/predicted pyridoxine 5'-phosphate oxidase superfamily flavin-nucleotide-binding protein
MNDQTTRPPTPPWHRGETAMQRSIGVDEQMAHIGARVIRSFLLEQHRAFFAAIPFVVIGSVDGEGDPWATLRAGTPGFLHAPNSASLVARIERDFGDPAESGMEDGDGVALLGIDLRTRRRNRLNGTIRRASASGFQVVVGQSFGNCPQYIQLRAPAFSRDPALPSPTPPAWMTSLDARSLELIRHADTFFVASYVDRDDGRREVDVSHRGGNAGFVRVGEDGTFTIPDFSGNSFFNTLGNLLVNPRAGLVFVDFERGDLLQLSGTTEIVLDSPELADFQGAERFWRFTPQRMVYRAAAVPMRWTFAEDGWSPNSLMTGNWTEAAGRQKAQALATRWRTFTVAHAADESAVIRSVFLEPADEAGLPPHLAGQHVPVQLAIPGCAAPVLRNYTLSVAPSDGVYRISVKKDGLVSGRIHTLKVGDTIALRAPVGTFVMDAAAPRPAVLMGVGVGITPIVAMLRHLVYEGTRTRRFREAWVFHAARSLAERAFTDEIRQLALHTNGAVRLVRLLTDTSGARQGRDFDLAGRLDIDVVRRVLSAVDCDFYLCGPDAFMQAMYDGLRAINVPDGQILAEAFGPSALVRRNDDSSPVFVNRPAATAAVPVSFLTSAREARWEPGVASLLDLAEANGLSPPFACRIGTCGTCRTRLAAGQVSYTAIPSVALAEGDVLICCAVPAAGDATRPSSVQLEL